MTALSTWAIETGHNNIQYTVRVDVYTHLILPASLRTLYRISREAGGAWKHADVHRGGFAAGLDAHRHHHGHLPPQTQKQETGEGADWEEVCGLNLMFN